MEAIPNILAERYASSSLKSIWSPRGKILLERRLWIEVMKAQRELGVAIPGEAADAFESVIEAIDLDDIRAREKVTRHDVKARLEAFCAQAGFETLHLGMTSRDLTENVEQLQIYRSLHHVRGAAVANLCALRGNADRWRDLVITARTHNAAAQTTTMGRRLAMHGEELILGLERLDDLIRRYPFRGLKGAVGTQTDLLNLFDGDTSKVAEMERRVLAFLGGARVLEAAGQVYPRSLDLEVVGVLLGVAAPMANFARSMRLMAGFELVGEGVAKGQVGSSAMPHKINLSKCERIDSFQNVIRGHLAMLAGLSGEQWFEGDVACSVVRRVVFPDAFFAIDGLLATGHHVLGHMVVYPAMISRENRRFQPFLSTTAILMAAVKAGVGRETAHSVIREHATAVSEDLRSGRTEENDLFDRLVVDGRLGLSAAAIAEVVAGALVSTGLARSHVDTFGRLVGEWEKRFPEAVRYGHEIEI